MLIPKFFFVSDIIEKRRSLSPRARRAGWLFDVLNCINSIPTSEFYLADVYRFTQELQRKHMDNHHVEAKIRQQLQFLRDKGFIEFLDRGHYRKI